MLNNVLWQELIVAVSLVMIIEGVLPFVSPDRWRQMASYVAQLSNSSLRKMGLISMVMGVVLLYWVK